MRVEGESGQMNRNGIQLYPREHSPQEANFQYEKHSLDTEQVHCSFYVPYEFTLQHIFSRIQRITGLQLTKTSPHTTPNTSPNRKRKMISCPELRPSNSLIQIGNPRQCKRLSLKVFCSPAVVSPSFFKSPILVLGIFLVSFLFFSTFLLTQNHTLDHSDSFSHICHLSCDVFKYPSIAIPKGPHHTNTSPQSRCQPTLQLRISPN